MVYVKSLKWYYGLVCDVKYLNTITKHEAVDRILDLFKDSYIKWDYRNGAFFLTSMYESVSLIPSSSNFNKVSTTNKKPATEIYSEMLEEKELIIYLFNRIDVKLPALKREEHILLVFYHHFLQGMSYQKMVEKGIYRFKKRKFYQDKERIYNLLAQALNF